MGKPAGRPTGLLAGLPILRPEHEPAPAPNGLHLGHAARPETGVHGLQSQARSFRVARLRTLFSSDTSGAPASRCIRTLISSVCAAIRS